MAKKKVKASKNTAKAVESIKMEMVINDRLAVQALCPREGNIITLTLARDIKQKTELTQADFKKHNIKPAPNGGLTWTVEKKGITVTFTSAEIALLKAEVDKLDKTSKITPDILSFCLAIKEK